MRVGNSLWVIGQSTVLKQGAGKTWTPIPSLVPSNATGTAAPTATAGK